MNYRLFMRTSLQTIKFDQAMIPWTNFQFLPLEFYEREDCISSRVRPFVSGTSFTTNSTVKAQTMQNIKKEAVELQEKRELKLRVTIHEPNQAVRDTRLPAIRFIFKGNISDIMTHGIPPMPIENVAI